LILYGSSFTAAKKTNLTAYSASSNNHKSREFFSSAYEPLTFYDADRYEAWRDAMKTEIQVLCSNNIWFLVFFNHSMNVIGYRYVYKIKRHVDDIIEHYKARLVARSFS